MMAKNQDSSTCVIQVIYKVFVNFNFNIRQSISEKLMCKLILFFIFYIYIK